MGKEDSANYPEESPRESPRTSLASARTSTGSLKCYLEERERKSKGLKEFLQNADQLGPKTKKLRQIVDNLGESEELRAKRRSERSRICLVIEKTLAGNVCRQGSKIVIEMKVWQLLSRLRPAVPFSKVYEMAKKQLQKDLQRTDKRKRFALNVQKSAQSKHLSKAFSLLHQGRNSVNSIVLQHFKDDRKSLRPPDVPTPSQGLQNIGNTSYMNSALNSLFYLPPLKLYMERIGGHAGTDLASAFQGFCAEYQKGSDMRGRLYEIQRSLPEFADGRQHCSHSFILKFLAKLDKDIACDCPLGPEFLQSLFVQRFTNYQKAKCKELHSLFSVLTENIFTCSNCFFSWTNMSYSRTLDLPITSTFSRINNTTYFSSTDFYCESVAKYYRSPSNRSDYQTAFKLWQPAQLLHIPTLDSSHLEDCFEFLLRASLMTASNTIDCEGCGRPTQHYKQSFLRHLSPILMLHFQRYNEATGQKLETRIRCPDKLDMEKYVPGSGQYRLVSIINHYGSLSWGHYTAYIRAAEDWYHFNDSMLQRINYTADLDSAAYVVTYIRQQTHS